MPKYFYDFEFIEGFHKPLFGKRRHFIDMISVGIVCDDGRSYSAISNEFNPKDASKWVKENVIDKLQYKEAWEHDQSLTKVYEGWEAVKKVGKSNQRIAADIKQFFYYPLKKKYVGFPNFLAKPELFKKEYIELYGDHAAYDHVLLASLFGTMMDLPAGVPMYTIDVKQMIDDWVIKALPDFAKHAGVPELPFEVGLKKLEAHPEYPKQTNQHNALADAQFIYELYKFLQL